MKIVIRSVLFAALTSGLMAADAPYAGKWKMNPAKSNFGDTTVTYEQMSGGEFKVIAEGQSYTFKTDGKEYPTPWGTTSAWKTVDANTWETTNKVNGKLMGTDTVKLSADGKTLTVDSKVIQASGGTSNDSAVYQRVSGGPGLAGKWKTKTVKSSAPEVMELTPKGSDGLAVSFANEGASCDAKFDGKDYPATGSMWPSGCTCSIAKAGENGLDISWKKDGKQMFKSSMTASGKTLTETGTTPGSTEKVKIVYDKQ